MSNENHRTDIINTIRETMNTGRHGQIEFSDAELQSLEKNLFKQVDSDIARTQRSMPVHRLKHASSGRSGLLNDVVDRMRSLVESATQRPAILAVAGILVLLQASVIFSIVGDGRQSMSGRAGEIAGIYMPDQLVQQSSELVRFIEPDTLAGIALVSTNKTDRYRAFEAGVLIADLQVLEGQQRDVAELLIKDYVDKGLAYTAYTEGYNYIDIFFETIKRFMQNRETEVWLQQGHLLEAMYLASVASMSSLDVSLLRTLLDQYKSVAEKTFYGSQNSRYMDNHKALVGSVIDGSVSPDEIADITTLISNLKVLAQ